MAASARVQAYSTTSSSSSSPSASFPSLSSSSPSSPPRRRPTQCPPLPPSTPSFRILPEVPGKAARVRVLVGPGKHEFSVDAGRLWQASDYFREAMGSGCLWLPHESARMFGLFAGWLEAGPGAGFAQRLQAAVEAVAGGRGAADGRLDGDSAEAQRLHWSLVHLHVFAARLELCAPQDAAMDALQDLYLHRDWNVTPSFVRFLYDWPEPAAAAAAAGQHPLLRLRRWAVAMVVWQLATRGAGPDAPVSPLVEVGGNLPPGPPKLRQLFARFPQLAQDYADHISKMAGSGLDLCVKNPQLRISVNLLRTKERQFAFRHCSFHSHRASASEGPCPHSTPLSTPHPIPPPDADSVARPLCDHHGLDHSPPSYLTALSPLTVG